MVSSLYYVSYINPRSLAVTNLKPRSIFATQTAEGVLAAVRAFDNSLIHHVQIPWDSTWRDRRRTHVSKKT